MNLLSKNIIVTGGASGIGKATVEKLLAAGANVGILDIDETNLNSLQSESPKYFCQKCDISDDAAVEAAIDKIFGKFGTIDAVVNNAGIVKDAPLFGFKKHDLEIWHEIINVNLNSVFYVTRHVVEKMFKKRTKGVVVNVSSVVAASGNAGQSAYSAAKAGVEGLTKTWAKELSPLGIRVAGIAPGFTLTKIAKYSMNDKIKEDWVKKTPVKRMADPDEIADGILFILKNDFFHGKILPLDGGLIT